MATATMPYQVNVTGITDIGLIRSNNEDFFKLLPDFYFFVLADGMGGHQAGEVASKETVENLCSLFLSKMQKKMYDLRDTEIELGKIIQEVNRFIYQLSRENLLMKGMGTTLCCVLIHPEGLIYAHVGDSRIYIFRKKRLEQLTHDHSLLRELIDLGQLSEQQAEEFSYKNIITKAIGTSPLVEASIKHVAVCPGDVVMMCTDGLSDLLNRSEIEKILCEYEGAEPEKVLIQRAKERGGHDNITIVLIKIDGPHVSNLP